MIDVLVHRLAPLLPRHRAEERVCLLAGGVRAAFDEFRNDIREVLPLRRKLALIRDDE